MQYLGLATYTLVEALFFAPILLIASQYGGEGTIASAGIMTASPFLGSRYNSDHKERLFFLGGILNVMMFAALGIILCSWIFGFHLGVLFSAAMVVVAGGYILYETSAVMRHYPDTAYVAASLRLFSAVALLFFYILRIFRPRLIRPWRPNLNATPALWGGGQPAVQMGFREYRVHPFCRRPRAIQHDTRRCEPILCTRLGPSHRRTRRRSRLGSSPHEMAGALSRRRFRQNLATIQGGSDRSVTPTISAHWLCAHRPDSLQATQTSQCADLCCWTTVRSGDRIVIGESLRRRHPHKPKQFSRRGLG